MPHVPAAAGFLHQRLTILVYFLESVKGQNKPIFYMSMRYTTISDSDKRDKIYIRFELDHELFLVLYSSSNPINVVAEMRLQYATRLQADAVSHCEFATYFFCFRPASTCYRF